MENTLIPQSFKKLFKDHLHIRGEYFLEFLAILFLPGSPPHTWRILNDDAIGALGLRITSTYVENTSFHIDGTSVKVGSPPHTWRIPVVIAVTMDRDRITSTYVENTNF